MGKRVAFIGHRHIFCADIKERIRKAIEEEIKDGADYFIVGEYGDFDQLALSTCKMVRKTHPEIDINVVLTSLHRIAKKDEWDYTPYSDVNTVMYEIEEVYFKKKITVSNQLMINDCDSLICYVNKERTPSGAKTAMNYAKRNGKKVINLFRPEDDPTFGMSREEKLAYYDKEFKDFMSEKK